jgi:hypothetical protein
VVYTLKRDLNRIETLALILKLIRGKMISEGAMKRNKRTEKVCHQDLAPLTERISIKMGSEGAEIRRRLEIFYQNRVDTDDTGRVELEACESLGMSK